MTDQLETLLAKSEDKMNEHAKLARKYKNIFWWTTLARRSLLGVILIVNNFNVPNEIISPISTAVGVAVEIIASMNYERKMLDNIATAGKFELIKSQIQYVISDSDAKKGDLDLASSILQNQHDCALNTAPFE